MSLVNRHFVLLNQSIRYYSVSSVISSTIQSNSSVESSSPSFLDSKHSDNQQDNFVYQAIIGLSVSCRLNVSSKLFSRSSTNYFASPNSNVSFFDVSLPGTLPVINRRCLELAIKSALALHCQVNSICSFDREHYFDPDYPSGLRLIQAREPIAAKGYLDVAIFDHSKESCYVKTVELLSIHLEEDHGSTIFNHLDQFNCVNLNSRGLPILKFNFKPLEISPQESACLVHELLTVLKRIGATSNRIEERVLSVDVSVQSILNSIPNKSTTIKKCNSYKALGSYIANEIGRQKSLLKRDGLVYDDQQFLATLSGGVRSIHKKNLDSRLMSEPSIPPFVIHISSQDPANETSLFSLSKLENELPLLPDKERLILVEQFGLALIQAQHLIINNYTELFMKIMSKDDSLELDSDKVYLYIMTVIEKSILQNNSEPHQLYDYVDHVIECFKLLSTGSIIHSIAIKMIDNWLQGAKETPKEMIHSNEWSIIEDDNIITEYCKRVIENRCTIAFLVKRGEKKMIKNLVKRVRVASSHRIPEDKIIDKLETLIENIDRATLSNFVSTRNKSVNRPYLFPND